MRKHIFALAALGVRERAVVERLRAADESDASGRDPITDLRRAASVEGYAIGGADMRNVTQDELRLLAWLTLFQRQRPELPVRVARSLLPALTACARGLEEGGCRLSYQNVARAADAFKPCEDLQGEDGMAGERAHRGLLQARALRLVKASEVAAMRQFAEIGISRQIISQMCRRGLLRRIRHGVYASGAGRPS